MNKTLPEVIADILTHNGAVVERKKEDGFLDVLVPPDVSRILEMPEYARLRFSYDESRNDAIYASYDSDFFTSAAKLFDNSGKFSVAGYEFHTPNIAKLSKLISEKVAFNNATFRLEKTEVKNISYLLFYFKYVALSDEKCEGILSLLINELNLSTMPLEYDITELEKVAGELQDAKRNDVRKVFQSACSASGCIVKEKLSDFIKSLERRLNRDIKRVYEYYDTLKEETKKAIKKKAIANGRSDVNFVQKVEDCISRHDMQAVEKMDEDLDNLVEKQIKNRTIKGDGIDKLINKLNAIEAEREWKVQDLVAKYALSIKIEPISTIRIETQSVLFWINIKRRLSSRQFPVTFNPITRQIDALPCESCFNPRKPYYICDDELHIICANCFRTCPDCGKQYCSVCYSTCPRCRKRKGNE